MADITVKNLFDGIPESLAEEKIDGLLETSAFRVERIVSRGQASPPGYWYDQEEQEWVLLLSGSAGLKFFGQDALTILKPGDSLLIPAHARHRVEWTDPAQDTVWLAFFFSG
ncbi:cupin domain-containing protein [Syntrophus aciditrophicus]|uniref:Phosphoribosylaminoimidazole carboxylase ATPase subunit n=1 Tax=Syntrophus aciditrophicus (strain SB) TaxID=56780 RepID=Q2LX48_SYNAS|nr:cupin domain-containing protein [Syntrophus aciditrophicus]ABC78662.1 phosphoribosylaminoimidazole carboxylase ATPase subunit [Syntrophus aciditrophicus SB]